MLKSKLFTFLSVVSFILFTVVLITACMEMNYYCGVDTWVSTSWF